MNLNSDSNFIPILLFAIYALILVGVPFLANRRNKHVLDTREARRAQTKRDLKAFLDELRND